MPKRHGANLPELVAQVVQQAGYPEPAWVETSAAPYVQGGRHARVYRGAFNEPHWLVHARIGFAQEVVGPMLVGTGRFVGFGLCLPDRTAEAAA